MSKFKKGDKVRKTFYGMGGYTEVSEARVHSVVKGVIYLVNEGGGDDDREEGITYDQNGKERENFFPGMTTTIQKL